VSGSRESNQKGVGGFQKEGKIFYEEMFENGKKSRERVAKSIFCQRVIKQEINMWKKEKEEAVSLSSERKGEKQFGGFVGTW